MFTDEQYLEHIKALWKNIGGYPLTDWKVGHNPREGGEYP